MIKLKYFGMFEGEPSNNQLIEKCKLKLDKKELKCSIVKELVVGQSRKKCFIVSFGACNLLFNIQKVHSGETSLEKCEICPLK